MGRAVLADADGIMREDEDGRQLHQCGETDRRPQVVREDQKGRAVGADLGQREPVADRAHRVFADAEMQVAAGPVAFRERRRTFEDLACLGGTVEVGRAADQPRIVLGDRILDLPGGVASGEALGVRREARDRIHGRLGRQAMLHRIELGTLLGVAGLEGGQSLLPGGAKLRTALADAVLEILVDAGGDQELRVLGPAIRLLGELDLFGAERLAVRLVAVLLVRRAVTDVALDDDQRRPRFLREETVDGGLQLFGIVRVAGRSARSSRKPGSGSPRPR